MKREIKSKESEPKKKVLLQRTFQARKIINRGNLLLTHENSGSKGGQKKIQQI